MKKKALILVEGPTEEAFIKQVIVPAIPSVRFQPVIVKTRIIGSQPAQKGGTVAYDEFKRQINQLLRDSTASVVSTMFDLQGLGTDFPGMDAPGSGINKALAVQAALAADINEPRFLPFIVLHEFEAFLFVNPAVVAQVLQRPPLANELAKIRSRFDNTPENINSSPATSPSAQIASACKRLCGSAEIFQKRTHGPIITKRIGVDQIRAACPHFDEWMKKLELFARS